MSDQTNTTALSYKETVLARFEYHRKFYSNSSREQKSKYQRIKLVQVILASAIPALVTYQDANGYVRIAAMAAGVLIAILEGAQQLYQHQENWTKYRKTQERIKRERALFDAVAWKYNLPDENERLKLFAERIEEIVSSETEEFGLKKE